MYNQFMMHGQENIKKWIWLYVSICVFRDWRNSSCRVSLIINVIPTLFGMWRRNRR